MSLRIRDITDLNPNTEFRSDVQISNYRAGINYELVKSYMFTTGDFPGKKSSAELLDILTRAVLDKLENRFLIQATYGHGKSHFGLALANFFGKAEDTPEIKVLLENLAHSLNNASRLEYFKAFKKYQKPFLIVILRGDTPGNLRDKFFRGLDEALKDHVASREVRPPFWFEEALRFVESLGSEGAAKAEAFLEAQRLDLAGLRNELEERRSDRYQLCVDLFRTVTGFYPNFGGETSLSEAIDWAVHELCGDGKPFGGMLILFDEFSVFVGEYAARHPTGVPLQELLNGVEANRGSVLFIAFAQHEPERLARDDGTASAQALIKELTRLPMQTRYQLHSSLEDVLRAYFKLDELSWKQFVQQGQIAAYVAGASEMAYGAYRNRYQRLGWSTEEFQERVAKACFPLHPLTTVLLSSLELEAAATTRSVLGFLKDDEGALKPYLDQPAALDGKPNWVIPIRLVDYFEDMLGAKVWEQYENVSVPDLTLLQKAVLKGMALQLAGGITTRQFGSNGYARLIAELCGCSTAEAEETLKLLEEQRYIRYDSANRTYSFWAGSSQALELERMLNEEIDTLEKRGQLGRFLDEPDHNGLTKVNELLSDNKSPLFKNYPVSVGWGHAEDWAAQEVVLTRKTFNHATLLQLTARYRATLENYPNARGLVILPIATSQEDVYWYRDNIQKELDTSAYLKSAPLLVLRPSNPIPDLPRALIKYTLLNSTTFSDRAIRRVGTSIFDEEKARYETQIKAMLQQLRTESEIEVPLEARGRVNAVAIGSRAVDRVEHLLKEVYTIAYAKGPKAFFTQYRHASGTRLRDAVSDLIPVLVTNNLAHARAGLSAVASETVNLFLEGDWGVVSSRNQLQVPTSDWTLQAWNLLDAAFPPGDSRVVGIVFEELLNSPYAYDYNTLTLLFCCWYGFNRRDLELALNGRLININDDLLTSGRGRTRAKPNDFIKAIGQATLLRRNRSEQLAKLQTILVKVEQGGLTRQEAENAVAILRKSSERFDHLDDSLTAEIELAHKKLSEGLSLLLAYENKVEGILSAIDKGSSINDFARLLSQVAELIEPVTVKSALPSPKVLQGRVLSRISERTQAICTKYSGLTRLTDYGIHEAELNATQRELRSLGLSELATSVQVAKEKLEQAKRQLEIREREQQTLERIEAFSVGARFAELLESKRQLEQLQAEGSERVKREAAAKLAAIIAEIKRLREFDGALPERIDAIRSAAAAREIREEILVQRQRFVGSNRFEDISRDQQRCEQLERYFRTLEAARQPASLAEAEAAINQLKDLPQRFNDYLNDGQRQAACDAVAALQAYVKDQEAKAALWLQALADELADGRDLKAIEEKLATPHPFFTDDHRAQLHLLKEQLMAKQNAQREEARVLQAIGHIAESGSFAQLQKALEDIALYAPTTLTIQEALADKRAKIEAAIAELQTRLRNWQTSLANVHSLADAERLHKDILRNSTLYAGSPLQPEVEALATDVERAVRAWSEDQALQQRLKLLPQPATLVQLREQLSELTAMQERALSTSLKDAIAQRGSALMALQAQQSELLAEQRRKASEATSTSEVRKVLSVLNQLDHFFGGSDIEQQLKEELWRAEQLEGFLSALDGSSAPKLTHPDEAKAHIGRIESLIARYDAYLGEAHRQLARQRIARIQELLAAKQREARAWLERCKATLAQASASQLEQLERTLKTPPPFLPDADRPVLAELVEQVDRRIDENEVQSIALRFSRIKDPAKQIACLEQLQRLMQERFTAS